MLGTSIISMALTPVGRVLMIVLALVSWTVYQRHDAAESTRDRVTAAFEKARDEEVVRQKAVVASAIRAAEQRALDAEAKAAEFRGLTDELATEIKAAGKACPIDDSVRRRLLAIR